MTHFGDSPDAISKWLSEWDGADAGSGDWLGSSVVMSCAQWIARTAAATRLSLKVLDPENTSEAQQKQLLERGRLVLEVLQAALEGVDPAAFWPGIYFDLLFHGNAYWRLERGVRRRPVGLRRIDPTTITPAIQTSGTRDESYDTQPSGWYLNAGETSGSYLLPSEVIRLRYLMDPRCPALGIPPLLSALLEVQNDREAGMFARTVLKKLGFAGTVISPKTPGDQFNPQQTLAMKTQFQEQFSGSERGGTLLSMKPIEVHMMEAEALRGIELKEVRNITEERVCSLLGIQPSVIGLGTGLQQTKVGATSRENRRESWENGIIPLQGTIAWQFSHQLMPEFGIDPNLLALDWNRDQVAELRETPFEKAKRFAIGVKGPWWGANDARRAFGDEPLDGYDDLYIEPPAVARENAASGPEANSKGTRRIAGRVAKALALTEKQTGYHASQLANQQRLSLVAGAELELEVAAQRALMRSAVESVADDPAYQELAALIEGGASLPADGLEELAADLSERLRMPAAALAAGIQNTVESLIEEATYATIEAYRRVDQDDYAALLLLSAGLADELIGRWQDDRAGLLTAKIQDEATPNGISQILRKVARRRQVGVARLVMQVADRIATGPFKTPGARGLLIARTESRWAFGSATIGSAKAVGYQRFIVEDGVLETSDEDCRQRSGMEVSAREADELHAAEHPNGTMQFIPVFTRKTPTLGDIVSSTGQLLIPSLRQRGGELETQ